MLVRKARTRFTYAEFTNDMWKEQFAGQMSLPKARPRRTVAVFFFVISTGAEGAMERSGS